MWKLRDKIFSRDWVSCVSLDLGFLPQCVKQLFFFFFFSFDIQLLFPGAFSLDLAAIEGRVGADRLSEVNFVMFNNLKVVPNFCIFINSLTVT